MKPSSQVCMKPQINPRLQMTLLFLFKQMYVNLYKRSASALLSPVRSLINFSGTFASKSLVATVAPRL